MKINWVNKKTIDSDVVNSLLSECESSRHFTNFGPTVKKLEAYLHTALKLDQDKRVIMVCNGAGGLDALAGAMSYMSNKKLRFAVQSFTFPCSVQGELQDSIVLDIDSNMGPNMADLERLKDSYDGIVITNSFGNCVNIELYQKFCSENDKIMIFDNASSPLTMYRGKNILNYGNGCMISLHHTKPLGFGEGGAIIVDSKYYESVVRMISFGYYQTDRYSYHPLALNYKMSDVSAAYIYQWVLNINTIVEKITKLRDYFLNKINLAGLKTLENYADPGSDVIISTMPILFPTNISTEFFINKDIEVKKYYYPLKITFPMYHGKTEEKGESYSENIFNRIVCFPVNSDMSFDDVDFIFEAISEYTRKS